MATRSKENPIFRLLHLSFITVICLEYIIPSSLSAVGLLVARLTKTKTIEEITKRNIAKCKKFIDATLCKNEFDKGSILF
jgi:hypothetical protein